MNVLRLSFSVAIVHLYCLTTTQQQEPHNITLWAKSRQKRFLVYQNAGVFKYIINFALPVDLQDKRPWRVLSSAWNFQWQHNLPLTPIHWWNSTYFPASSARSFGEGPIPSSPQPIDLTAIFLYAMIESYMNNKGMNGRECMQRAICANAQVHYVGGLIDKIYQRLLTPEPYMEEYYKDSYTMGSKGVDCYKTYFACPKGESIFDQFVQIENMK